jgi:hypothetical protein
MMHNIQKVTEHLNEKTISSVDKPGLMSLVVIPSREDSRPYFQGSAGDCWRIYYHIPHVDNPVLSKSPKRAFEAGRAFGSFLTLLSDFPVRELAETIPQFHVLDKRLETFDDVVRGDPAGRVAGVADELGVVKARRSRMLEFSRELRSGGIPVRVTHNDTKANNVLFNESGRAVAVIDLDTVMPGYVHHDFGDAIRTIANPAKEDETNLDRVKFDEILFEGFARGFLGETKRILNRKEIATLAFHDLHDWTSVFDGSYCWRHILQNTSQASQFA